MEIPILQEFFYTLFYGKITAHYSENMSKKFNSTKSGERGGRRLNVILILFTLYLEIFH